MASHAQVGPPWKSWSPSRPRLLPGTELISAMLRIKFRHVPDQFLPCIRMTDRTHTARPVRLQLNAGGPKTNFKPVTGSAPAFVLVDRPQPFASSGSFRLPGQHCLSELIRPERSEGSGVLTPAMCATIRHDVDIVVQQRRARQGLRPARACNLALIAIITPSWPIALSLRTTTLYRSEAASFLRMRNSLSCPIVAR